MKFDCMSNQIKETKSSCVFKPFASRKNNIQCKITERLEKSVFSSFWVILKYWLQVCCYFFLSAIEYIIFLHQQKKKQEEELEALRKEVMALKIMKA